MSTYKATISRYIDDVMSGAIPAGEYQRLAVQRYLNDHKYSIELGIRHDAQAAERVIKFFSFIRHTKGSQFAGKPFTLEPWQIFILWNIFGWKRANGTRRFRQSYVEIARKNGKSAFASGIGLYMMRKDSESSSEVYSAATTRDQAKIVFDQAGEMVRKSNVFKKDIEVFKNSIFVKPGHDEIASGSFFKAVSSEANTLDGLNPHCAIIDEFHAHKTTDVFDVFADAMGARLQPMLFTITTAGFSRESPCYRYRKNCIDILKGIKKDESLFTVIYTKDEDDDWQDAKAWEKSNPNLNVSIGMDFLKDQAVKAKNNNEQLNSFLTKNLNIWTDSYTAWIPDDTFMACKADIPEHELRGVPCYAGLDLAATSDFNALVLVFCFDNGKKYAKPYFWVPEDTVKQRDHVAAYSLWKREGHLYTTEGNVVDHSFIVKKIIELSKKFNIKSIAYDRAMAYHGTIQELTKANIPVTAFSQAITTISTPTKEMEKMILSGQLQHDGNAVLRWMNSNVVIYRDANENFKIHKGKSQGKVDGMVAMVMGIGQWMELNSKQTGTPSIRFL